MYYLIGEVNEGKKINSMVILWASNINGIGTGPSQLVILAWSSISSFWLAQLGCTWSQCSGITSSGCYSHSFSHYQTHIAWTFGREATCSSLSNILNYNCPNKFFPPIIFDQIGKILKLFVILVKNWKILSFLSLKMANLIILINLTHTYCWIIVLG